MLKTIIPLLALRSSLNVILNENPGEKSTLRLSLDFSSDFIARLTQKNCSKSLDQASYRNRLEINILKELQLQSILYDIRGGGAM